jgi:hypothetical protein
MDIHAAGLFKSQLEVELLIQLIIVHHIHAVSNVAAPASFIFTYKL